MHANVCEWYALSDSRREAWIYLVNSGTSGVCVNTAMLFTH